MAQSTPRPRGCLADGGHRVLLAIVDGDAAQFFGDGQSPGELVHDKDGRRPGGAHGLQDAQTDGPRAEDDDAIRDTQFRQVGRVNGDAQRFQQRRARIVDGRRDGEARVRRHVHPL